MLSDMTHLLIAPAQLLMRFSGHFSSAASSTVNLHLVHIRPTLEIHHFDQAAGDAENWQGQEDDISWPKGTGHVRRPAELKGGVRKKV